MSVRAEACNWLRAAQWVAMQNFVAGKAPTGCKLVDRLSVELQKLGLEVRFGREAPCPGKCLKTGVHGQKMVPMNSLGIKVCAVHTLLLLSFYCFFCPSMRSITKAARSHRQIYSSGRGSACFCLLTEACQPENCLLPV